MSTTSTMPMLHTRRSSPLVVGCCLAAAAVLTATPASAAGTVKVSFAPTDHFTDAGGWGRRRDDNLLELSLHLQRLGQRRLPDGQTLNVEVLDVDLAGRLKPLRNGQEIRVVDGRVDWPRIRLRWALSSTDGRPLRSGEETLTDMSFLTHHAGRLDTEPLRYEKALLDDWFEARFASDAHARATP